MNIGLSYAFYSWKLSSVTHLHQSVQASVTRCFIEKIHNSQSTVFLSSCIHSSKKGNMVVQECKCLPSILKARKGKSHDATQRKGLIQKIDPSRTGKARPSASIVSNSAKKVGSIPELSQIFRLLSWAGARNCTTFAIHKPHPESGRSSAESSFC